MLISGNKLAEKLIWFLTVFLFTTFVVFDTYTWGRYAFFGACLMILLLSAMTNRWRITLQMNAYYAFYGAFITYCAISSLWALDPSDSIQQASTIGQTLVCSVMLYIHYEKDDSIDTLLSAVKWAGYAVAAYCFLHYGKAFILSSLSAGRLDNAFSNVNRIAMVLSLSAVIQFWEILFRKAGMMQIFLTLPSIILIAATQSRKALVLVLLGCLCIVVIKNLQNINILKSLARIVLIVAVFIIIVWVLSSLPMFAGIRKRMEGLIAAVTGNGVQDNSARVRNEMIALGWSFFKQHPLGGVGMGNPHILAAKYLRFDAYLHNNYIEILCGGGIVGCLLYYSMYLYLFASLMKYRNLSNPGFVFGIVWLVLIMIMDWGMVSYYTKNQMFYFMIHFLNVNCLKKQVQG